MFKLVNKEKIPTGVEVLALNQTLLKDGKLTTCFKTSVMYGYLERNNGSHTGVMCVRLDHEADMPCTHYMTLEDILSIPREGEEIVK